MLKIDGLESKRIELWENDEEELQKYMVTQDRDRTNLERASRAIKEVIKETKLSKKQLQQSSK